MLRGLDAAALEVGKAVAEAAPALDQEDRELAITDGFGFGRPEPADRLARDLEVPGQARDESCNPRSNSYDDLPCHHLLVRSRKSDAGWRPLHPRRDPDDTVLG